jgi:hypothetical protein
MYRYEVPRQVRRSHHRHAAPESLQFFRVFDHVVQKRLPLHQRLPQAGRLPRERIARPPEVANHEPPLRITPVTIVC